MTRADDSPELVALRELHRLVLLVNSERNLADVLATAAQGVIDVIGFQAVAVNLLTRHGDFEVVTVLGPPHDALIGTRVDREILMEELAVADVWGLLRFVPEGRHQVPLDAGSFWTTTSEPLDDPDAWQRDDALYAPLHTPDGELLGIVSVDLPHDGRRPGPVRRNLLEMYVVQIALAITHARDRDRLAEQLRLSTATQRILQTAGASHRLDDILEASVAPLQEGFRAERTWIRLFADPGGAWAAVDYPEHLTDDLDEAARQGRPTTLAPVDTVRVLASGRRLAVACWEARRTLLVSTSGPDEGSVGLSGASRLRVMEWLEALGHQQFVMVPLGVGDQCLGYVALNRLGGQDWSEAEDRAALEVGRELGRVIGAARLRARERHLMERLGELDQYKSRVMTTIIHELKNPLAVVKGNLELAADEPALAAKAHAAIARGAERMQVLVDDLLTLTRLREAEVDLDRVPIDLSSVVADVVGLVRDQAALDDIGLDVSAVEDGVKVLSERSEMDRLVLNLVSNAIKYSSPGDVVALALTAGPDGVDLTCTDTGLGIASEDMASIFDEFDRSSSPTARSRPGSGLGLAIVRRIVQRHHGTIEVTSQLGNGSTFAVHLPSS